jgi:OmpA-OmpF porin, OOP family
MLSLLSLGTAGLQAQIVVPEQFLEGGLGIGTTAYGGDLRSSDVIFLDQPGISLNLGLRYQLSSTLAMRADATYGRLGADEANDNAARQSRGYSFRSGIFELSLRGEWHPFGNRRYADGVFQSTWSPYLFGGLGAAFKNPDPDFNGETDLPGVMADLNNEENSTLVIPFGFGVRFDLDETIAIGVEYGYRFSRSDYLDGISQAANPDKNDRYAIALLQIWKRFGSDLK